MIINLLEIFTPAVKSQTGTFAFIGKGYIFPIVRAFSYYLKREKHLPEVFHKKIEESYQDSINLFNTSSEEFLESLIKPCLDYRLIPFDEKSFTTSSSKSKLSKFCTVIEVPTITPDNFLDCIKLVCILLEVESNEKTIKQLSSRCSMDFSSIYTSIEYAAGMGGLVSEISILPVLEPDSISYQDLKNTVVFGTNLQISILIKKLGTDFIPYTGMLLNDLALYSRILSECLQGVEVEDLSSKYHFNIVFLRTKLLPRLKSWGVTNILSMMRRIADSYKGVLDGSILDGPLILSASILVET